MIIVDTNILIAAIIRDSTVRRLLFSDYEFIAPYVIMQELEEHESEVKRKSRLDDDAYDRIRSLIISKIRIISLPMLFPYVEEAECIMHAIDPDDAMFVACALAYPGSSIWSDDPDLKEQKMVPVLDTKEMKALLSQ